MRLLQLIISIFMVNMTFSQEVNYVDHIRPIIDQHCMPCHDTGNIGPIPLTNYQEVSSYGAMIEYVTSTRIMPPWKADHRYSVIEGANVLPPDKIRLIKDWVEGGLLQGIDTNATPPSDSLISMEQDSSIVTFSMAESFIHQGDYTPLWQVFVIPTKLKDDLYINEIEFIPGNRSIVKSCAISIDTSQLPFKYDKTDVKYGYNNLGGLAFIPHSYLWYFWTPDQQKRILPEPYIKKIPKGSSILMHIQYAPTGQATSDSSSLRLHTTGNKPESSVIYSEVLVNASMLLGDEKFIEPHDKRSCHTNIVLDKDITIHGLTPLGQYVNKSWKIYTESVNGAVTPLLQIQDWELQWKRSYQLVHPVTIMEGDEIIIEAYYDNTEENINIPQYPPRKTYPGEGRRDEMFMVQYDFSIPSKLKS